MRTLYIFSSPLSLLLLLFLCLLVLSHPTSFGLKPLPLCAPHLQHRSHLLVHNTNIKPLFPPIAFCFFLSFSSPFSPPLCCLSCTHTSLSLSFPHSFRHELTTPHLPSLFVSRIDDISAGECYCGNQSSAPRGCH